MIKNDCEAEESSSASHQGKEIQSGALEIDRQRRTGKLTTGKVQPGQLLEVNRNPIQSDSEAESGVEPPHSKDGKEIVQ